MNIPNPNSVTEINRWDMGWKVLQRYDQYIASTNAKAGFILALNGGVLTLLFNWLSICPMTRACWLTRIWPLFIAVLLIAVCAVIIATLFVVSPKLWSPKNNQVAKSTIFFGDVADQSCKDYTSLVKTAEDERLTDDILIQVHTVGSLLDEKFRLMQMSFRILIYLQMPLFLFMTATKILMQ